MRAARLFISAFVLAIASVVPSAANALTLTLYGTASGTDGIGMFGDVGPFNDVPFGASFLVGQWLQTGSISINGVGFHGYQSGKGFPPFISSAVGGQLIFTPELDGLSAGMTGADGMSGTGYTVGINVSGLGGRVGPSSFDTYDFSADISGLPGLIDNSTFSFYDGSATTSGTITIKGFSASSTTSIPEPATWAMMIMGFGLMGTAMRRPRQATVVFTGPAGAPAMPQLA